MARRELPVASGTIAFLIGAVLLALPSSLANAQQPPQASCVGVSKTEYDSIKDQIIAHHVAGARCRRRVRCKNPEPGKQGQTVREIGLDAIAETLLDGAAISAHEANAPVWVTPGAL